jgi:predicted O-methyltransferase YrrM
MFKYLYQRARWFRFWNDNQLPQISLGELVSHVGVVEPPILDKLCLPPYEGPTDHDDAGPLFTLVRAFDPKVVLELGTAAGATVANICALSQAQVYSVNALPEQISGNNVTYVLEKDEIGHVYRDHGFGERVFQIYENTKYMSFTDYLPLRSVDFAIIDACHDTDYVVSDFLKILPVLKNDAVVLFHDVHPNMKAHLRSSYIACMYLRKLGYDIRHLADTWWAIWQANEGKLEISVQKQILNWLDDQVIKVRGIDITRDATYLMWLSTRFMSQPRLFN